MEKAPPPDQTNETGVVPPIKGGKSVRRESVQNIRPGDYIELECKLGKGRVQEVLIEPDLSRPEVRGTFPMIRYTNTVTGRDQWCTYIVVRRHIHKEDWVEPRPRLHERSRRGAHTSQRGVRHGIHPLDRD